MNYYSLVIDENAPHIAQSFRFPSEPIESCITFLRHGDSASQGASLPSSKVSLMVWLIAICIAISALTALAFVPIIRFASHACGIVDQPDQERKLQAKPVALGGGLAVFIALVVGFVSTILIDRAYFGRILGDVSFNYYILFGAGGCLLLVGLIDDAWALRGRQKLLLQCLILFALVGGGTLIRQIGLFGYQIHLGVLAFPITVVWLLISVNALNLIDGADGVATTSGSIICIGLGAISLFNLTPLTAVIAFALAAALLVFLGFNKPPASIYLGDAGSMTIGLFVGVLAVWSSVKESTILASAPVAILAIPLFDSTAAILRRWLTGRSIYTTDRAHLHHLLLEKYGPTRTLVMVAALCITTTSLAGLSVILDEPLLAGLGVVLVAGLLIVTRSFGYAETRLLIGRVMHFAQSFTMPPTSPLEEQHHRRVSLQGEERWDTIWEPIVDFARHHKLVQVKIDLNLAWLHEGYHANWQSVRLPEKSLQLHISLPLFTNQGSASGPVTIGRLEVIGSSEDPEIYHRIAEFSELMTDLSDEIDRTVQRIAALKKKPQLQPRELPTTKPVTNLHAPAANRLNFEAQGPDAAVTNS